MAGYAITDNTVNQSYSNYLSRWYDEKEKALPEQQITSGTGSTTTSSYLSGWAAERANEILARHMDRAKAINSQSSTSPTAETGGTTTTSTSAGDSDAATTTGGSTESASGEGSGSGQGYKGAWSRLSERYPDMPTGDRKAAMEYLRSQEPSDGPGRGTQGRGLGYFMRRQWGDDHPGRGRGRGDQGGSEGSTGGAGGDGGGSAAPAAPAPVYTPPVAAGRDTAGGGERNDIPDHMKRAKHPQMPDMSSYSAPRPRYDAPTGRGYANPTVSRTGRF